MTKLFSMSRAATPALQGRREILTEILLKQHPLSISCVLRAMDLSPPLLSSPSLKPTKGTQDALGSQEQMTLEGAPGLLVGSRQCHHHLGAPDGPLLCWMPPPPPTHGCGDGQVLQCSPRCAKC